MHPSEPLQRTALQRPVVEVARDLLGRVLVAGTGADAVAVRLTEVEAYDGARDPASHSFRGRTPRNAVMFGEPGHLYTYFVYGMHWCANVVAGPPGDPMAVLLRAGEVVGGLDVARARRRRAGSDVTLARGPAALATVLGFDRSSNGLDLCAPGGPAALLCGSPPPAGAVVAGPRVGVAAAADTPYRFWIIDDPTVSVYRRHTRRIRSVARPRPGPMAG